MREVLHEPDSGYRPVATLYQDFLVRCRIHQLGSKVPDLAAFRRLLAVGKAGVTPEIAEHPEWPEALTLAAPLPDDLQGVFLLLAQAALAAAPCPSDAAIARAYGTRSTGRARRAWAISRNRAPSSAGPTWPGGGSSPSPGSAGKPPRATPGRSNP